MSDALHIDTNYVGQRARFKKTGDEGYVAQAYDFLDECYIEFACDDGRVFWPLEVHDLEVIHGAG